MAFLESIDTLYTEAKKPEEVIDGYLGDLPEDIQSDIMNIHKIIMDNLNSIIKTYDYSDLANDPWSKEQLNEFSIMPTDNSEVGSIRVYKKGKKYKCMVQVTGHFTNHMENFIEELMHEFIKNVFMTVRPIIRKKFDVTITNEGDHGNPFEGFDIFLSNKRSEEIWEKLSDRKSKTISENTDLFNDCIDNNEYGDIFDEKSHASLKYDYRQVYDANTGHRLICVYTMSGIKVTYPGHAWDLGHGYNISYNFGGDRDKYNHAISQVQKNIHKKGNTDHQSYGQKLVAVRDTKTDEQWTEKKNPGKEFKVKGFFSNNASDPTFTIKLGEIESEENKTFKSSKIFSKLDGDTSGMRRLSGVEPMLKYGRGAKINDIVYNADVGNYAYNHPSKKDIRDNPASYPVKDKYGNEYYINKDGILKRAVVVDPNLIIPNSVKKISDSAFRSCKSLKSIIIPNSVKEIGRYAFAYCRSLKSITIPNTVTTIGDSAFENCTSLTSVIIPNSVKEIGYGAFGGCKSLPDNIKKELSLRFNDNIFESYELGNISDDYITEKSHGKLKYDFRFAYNAKTGRLLKIVYDLNKDMDVEYSSGYHSISKKGNTDHNSKGQKVLAIIEYIDNPSDPNPRTKNLDHATCYGLFGYNPNKKFNIKVGEIDNDYSFKSTFFPGKHEFVFGNNYTTGNIKDVTIMGHECMPYQRGQFAKNKLYNNKTELMKYIYMKNNVRKYSSEIYDALMDRFINDYTAKNGVSESEARQQWFNSSRSMDQYKEYRLIEDKFDEIRAKRAPSCDDSLLSIIDDLARNYGKYKAADERHINRMKKLTDGLNQLLPGYIAAYKEAITSFDAFVKKYNLDIKCNKFHMYMESADVFTESPSMSSTKISGDISDLPKGFREFINDTNESILEEILNEMQNNKKFSELNEDEVHDVITWMDGKSKSDGYGCFCITKDKKEETYSGEVRLFPKTGKKLGYISRDLENIWDRSVKYVYNKEHKTIDKKAVSKKLTLVTDENLYTLTLVFSKEYAQKLWDYLINPRRNPLTESANTTDDTPEYNGDMSEATAKKTLGTLTAQIIDSSKPVSQYTANIYANIITKNLLPIWARGYRKLTITIDDDKKNNVFEFKIPTMSQDFVSRFIDGRETINGFLHRNPEIKIRMSSSIFKTLSDRNDGYNFFKNAVKYYDSQVEKYAMKMMSEVMKLNHEMKHLVCNTKLSALVTYPMTLLFVFDNVNMSNKDCFKISATDIAAVNKFIKGIYTNYASPEKEKKKIVEDLKAMIRAFNESIQMDDNMRILSYLPEAVATLMDGGYNDEIEIAHQMFIRENTDLTWPASSPDPQVKYLSEKFGVKKLKKIPVDLVAYIQIETESIQDSNDKMMIASYCLSKIEIVEWYIELLEVGSKKYIVPHNKQYLENVRTQLLQCYKDIMAVKITKPSDRPLIDIKYPKGYEG